MNAERERPRDVGCRLSARPRALRALGEHYEMRVKPSQDQTWSL
jgi:hypothetical protein